MSPLPPEGDPSEGTLPPRSPEQKARAEQATFAVQGPLAAARQAALRATAGGRQLLDAGEPEAVRPVIKTAGEWGE